MSPIAKGLVLLFGFPVILAILFFYFFMSTGEERMRTFLTRSSEVTLKSPTSTTPKARVTVPALAKVWANTLSPL